MALNKRKVDQLIPIAVDVLKKASGGRPFPKEFPGYISSFGASLVQGHLHASISFYSDNGGAQANRSDLMGMLLEMIKSDRQQVTQSTLLEYAFANPTAKSHLLEYVVALKLALNLFPIAEGDGGRG